MPKRKVEKAENKVETPKEELKARVRELMVAITNLQKEKKSLEAMLDMHRKELQEIMESQQWDIISIPEIGKKAELVRREDVEWDLQGLALLLEPEELLTVVKPDNKALMEKAKEKKEIIECRRVKGERRYLTIRDYPTGGGVK